MTLEVSEQEGVGPAMKVLAPKSLVGVGVFCGVRNSGAPPSGIKG